MKAQEMNSILRRPAQPMGGPPPCSALPNVVGLSVLLLGTKGLLLKNVSIIGGEATGFAPADLQRRSNLTIGCSLPDVEAASVLLQTDRNAFSLRVYPFKEGSQVEPTAAQT